MSLARCGSPGDIRWVVGLPIIFKVGIIFITGVYFVGSIKLRALNMYGFAFYAFYIPVWRRNEKIYFFERGRSEVYEIPKGLGNLKLIRGFLGYR